MLNTRRAPGADKKRVQYGFASDPVGLVQDPPKAALPIEHLEEAGSVPGVNLASGAVDMVRGSIDLNLEYERATMARNAANYAASNKVTLTANARWTQTAATPRADIKAGKEAVRRMTGRYPNTLIPGPNGANALCEHAAIREQVKYASAGSITLKMLARTLQLKRVVVGEKVSCPETAADTAAATDMRDDDAILAYVPDGGKYQVRPSATPVIFRV
ncbi:major capsid protein [Pseudogemmobacter bohemicus]|uniref:major capsid protein n=1 Tax=Pseudogemmobacter bohemicus TaxID=2250708 RepID=UPI001E620A0F|nr:major capsid protein [Pseudogemmobacter bohemicus]